MFAWNPNPTMVMMCILCVPSWVVKMMMVYDEVDDESIWEMRVSIDKGRVKDGNSYGVCWRLLEFFMVVENEKRENKGVRKREYERARNKRKMESQIEKIKKVSSPRWSVKCLVYIWWYRNIMVWMLQLIFFSKLSKQAFSFAVNFSFTFMQQDYVWPNGVIYVYVFSAAKLKLMPCAKQKCPWCPFHAHTTWFLDLLLIKYHDQMKEGM